MTTLDAALREAFAKIADILIPNAEGMPSASEMNVQGEMLDHILDLRPDLRDNFLRGLTKAAGRDASEAAKIAGVVTWNYGSFINAVIDFAIIAFVIFLMIHFINQMKVQVQAPAPAAAPVPVTKTCPQCATEIPLAAKRCPHCTSQL